MRKARTLAVGVALTAAAVLSTATAALAGNSWT